MTYSAYKLNKLGDFGLKQRENKAFLFLHDRRQVRWSGIPISLRIFQFVVIYTVKGFSVVNEAEVDVSLQCHAFSVIQRMLAF